MPEVTIDLDLLRQIKAKVHELDDLASMDIYIDSKHDDDAHLVQAVSDLQDVVIELYQLVERLP